jgi:hypothetical protein
MFKPTKIKRRSETGSMRFGDDLTGVFIRGDNAAYYAQNLHLDDEQIDDDDEEHLFIREILDVLRKEFPEARGEMYCYSY